MSRNSSFTFYVKFETLTQTFVVSFRYFWKEYSKTTSTCVLLTTTILLQRSRHEFILKKRFSLFSIAFDFAVGLFSQDNEMKLIKLLRVNISRTRKTRLDTKCYNFRLANDARLIDKS